jgi:hypothetical protein
MIDIYHPWPTISWTGRLKVKGGCKIGIKVIKGGMLQMVCLLSAQESCFHLAFFMFQIFRTQRYDAYGHCCPWPWWDLSFQSVKRLIVDTEDTYNQRRWGDNVVPHPVIMVTENGMLGYFL